MPSGGRSVVLEKTTEKLLEIIIRHINNIDSAYKYDAFALDQIEAL
ncbi:MAG: hypothetical protein ACI82Z_001446 [Cellvibrionaceae bacterium]|jgi:hypothetical protein